LQTRLYPAAVLVLSTCENEIPNDDVDVGSALQIARIIFGQDANEPGNGGPRHHEERFANLSADERKKLKAAP